MSSGPHISRRDPETVFELIRQIGSGSYGSVQKVYGWGEEEGREEEREEEEELSSHPSLLE
jgi:hypothetical protein